MTDMSPPTYRRTTANRSAASPVRQRQQTTAPSSQSPPSGHGHDRPHGSPRENGGDPFFPGTHDRRIDHNGDPRRTTPPPTAVPHQGALRRTYSPTPPGASYYYTLSLQRPKKLELRFDRLQYERIHRIFTILDTESRGLLEKRQVREFVGLRCPVFRRRDETVMRFLENPSREPGPFRISRRGFDSSHDGPDPTRPSAASTDFPERRRGATSTFEEVWAAVTAIDGVPSDSDPSVCLGIEGFLLFSRLISLTQYLEAKQRFCQRHQLQRDGQVLVDLPPPTPPQPVTLEALAAHDTLGAPELDLDHCLIAFHDDDLAGSRGREEGMSPRRVEVRSFGCHEDLAVSLVYGTEGGQSSSPSSVVRRTWKDVEWLAKRFACHGYLGSTLCGRIIPHFPKGWNHKDGLVQEVGGTMWGWY